ncbi:MAG TPA: BatA domain-containing protein, partial [Verrucomicrobiae bacterium]|nr:BatA domain-containing protein [Verrucomicrobiae bacterium]
MIPLLTYPLALIALATIPALAAIYILRNRFRRRQVSSLVLWRFHVQSKSGGAKIHRLQLPLLFFLELLALLLLVAAATGPRWKLPQ